MSTNHVQKLTGPRQNFWFLAVLHRKTIHKVISTLRQILLLLLLLLAKKEQNQTAECLLKRNWTKSVLVLHIPPENPSDALYRKQGFQAASLFHF
jgi:hypothetical protein